MSDEASTSKLLTVPEEGSKLEITVMPEGVTSSKEQPVKRRRGSSMHELKVVKKYCFDDLELDETEVDKIPEKCLLLIKKMDEGITVAKLEGLGLCIGKLKQSGLSKALTFDVLSGLVKKLGDIIKKGVNGNPNKDGKQITEINSLAVQVCLDIYTCEDMPTALYVEDCINDIILYFKHQIDELHSHFSKKGTGSKRRTNSLPGFVQSLIKNLGCLYEFVQVRHFTSPFLFNLITSCIFTVFHVFVYDVQMAVIMLLRSIFEKREEFRVFIMEDIFGMIKKIPENHKFVKDFVVGGTVRISMFSVLILCLVQCMANLKRIEEKILKESYENLYKIGGRLAVTFVGCCGSDIDHHKIYRAILDTFIGELIEVSNEPEWPGSKIVLQCIAKRCVEIVKEKTSSDFTLRMFSVKILDKIAGKIICNKALEAKAEELLLEFHNIEDLSEKEIAELLLISYLKDKDLLEVNYNCKYVYHVQWFENMKHENGFEEKKEFIINLLKKSNLIDKKISRDEARALVHYIDSKKFNYADYHVFLNYILIACYDPNKKMKAVGAQCLADLINLDPNLLSRTMVSKTVNECLSASSAVGREAICKLLDKFLSNHPEKAEEYDLYLLKLLSDDFISVRKASINAVKNLLLKKIDVLHAKELIYKILGLLRDEETSIQKEAVEFCKLLWLDEKFKEENFELLLKIVEMPNALKNLKMFFEEKLKPKEGALMADTQTQPETDVKNSCLRLAGYLIDKMKNEECKLACLNIISIIAMIRPEILNSFILEIATPLNETTYSKDFGVEILTAETLNYVLPEMVNPDVLALVLLIDKLVDKLNADESLNYTKRFIVSLIKLLKKLEKFGPRDFLLEKLFLNNLEVLEKCLGGQGSDDERIIIRAICIVTYLHVDVIEDGEKGKVVEVLEKFLKNKNLDYVLATIHSIAYLSSEYKLIMKNEVLRNVLEIYLNDRKNHLLTQAALYNILRSLENLKEENNNEIASDLIQKYLKEILDCSLEPNYEIRHMASSLISHILKSGLLMESRFIPYVVTMSTDPILENRRIGIDLLKLIHCRKTYDISRNPTSGILLSQKLISKISGLEFSRGYREQNEKIEARCNLLYALHQEDETKRRRLTESILNDLKTDAETTTAEKLYLIDNLASFTYKYQDEVLYLLRQIEHIKSVTCIPEECPDNNDEKIKFIKEFYGIYLLNPLKNYLQKLYGINDQKIAKYYGVETKKDLLTKRVGVKYFINEKMLPVGKENENFADIIFQEIKIPDGSDSQSNSGSDDLSRRNVRSPLPTGTPRIRLKKSVLTEIKGNTPERVKRLTKSEQKPKRNLEPRFNSAKKIKLSDDGGVKGKNESAAAKSLF